MKNVFEGVMVGSNLVDISILQFADDALIMGNGLSTMKKNLCSILRCFHMASDLKVNFAKSKFFGVGVSNTDTNTFASTHCCQPSSFPCSYLGLPIGANMNKSGNWNAIIEKFQKHLTSWKAKNISIGVVIKYLEKLRRNFFWGGDMESNKMAWISWKKICSPSTCRGLGVDSSLAFSTTYSVSSSFAATLVKSAFEEVNTGGIKVSARIKEINAGSLNVNTGSDPVTIDSIRASVPSPDREEAGLAEVIRLDALEKALEKEEVAKQVHLDSLLAQRMAEEQELTKEQKKRKAQVQFEAQYYTEEDWDNIIAKLKANTELKESVLGKDLTVEDYAKRMVELVNQRRKHFAEERARAKSNTPMTQTQLMNNMSNFLKNQGTKKLTQLKKLNFEEVKAEFEKLVKQLDTYAQDSTSARVSAVVIYAIRILKVTDKVKKGVKRGIALQAETKSPASWFMIYETKQLKEIGRTRTQVTSHNDISALKNSTTINLAKVSSDYKREERRRMAKILLILKIVNFGEWYSEVQSVEGKNNHRYRRKVKVIAAKLDETKQVVEKAKEESKTREPKGSYGSKGLLPYGFEKEEMWSRGGRIARWKVFRGVWVSRLENVQQGGDVAFLVTKGGNIFMLAGNIKVEYGDHEMSEVRNDYVFVESGYSREINFEMNKGMKAIMLMKGASFTQRTVSSISVGGSINLEGFLSSILLSVVIIVTVVIVVVILIVVVVDDVPFILKLSFVIIGFLHGITLYYLIHYLWDMLMVPQ
ncbi:hypothetical protein Tco_1213005 [Tanacetum coccineum]